MAPKKQSPIGAVFVEGRKRAQISQRELADRLNLAQSFIVKIEHGDGAPDPKHAEAIGKALGVDPVAVRDAIWAYKFPGIAPQWAAPAESNENGVFVPMPPEIQRQGREFARRRKWPSLEALLLGLLEDVLAEHGPK